MALYFENTKTGKQFKVLEWNEATGEVTLQGEFAKFTENFDKKKFKSMNYKLVEIADDTDDTDGSEDED